MSGLGIGTCDLRDRWIRSTQSTWSTENNFPMKYSKVSSIQNCMEDYILATGCPVVIFIFIFFSFHKHSRLGDIFLLHNRSLFSSQIAISNLHASIKPPINKGNQYPHLSWRAPLFHLYPLYLSFNTTGFFLLPALWLFVPKLERYYSLTTCKIW